MHGLADFHHLEFVVSNALQASFWYSACFGFRSFAKKIENGTTSIAVRNGNVILVLTSSSTSMEVARRILLHGDAIRDVAFRVDNLDMIIEKLAECNVGLLEEKTILEDEYGTVSYATIRSKDCDVTHCLIQDSDYKGIFLPGYEEYKTQLPTSLTPITMLALDHVVHGYPHDSIEDVVSWYQKTLDLNRFWSVDDKVDFQLSALKAWLVTNKDHRVQYTLAETVPGRKGKSQIEEFVHYNGGPGIQHIAFRVESIIEAVSDMKKRSVEFLTVPSTYYDLLEERLKSSKVDLKEDIDKLRSLNILMDFDDNGYLLQIFTKQMQDRPCLFVEIIQRRNFNGFGAGNFKALFDAVEREQALRGTLCDE